MAPLVVQILSTLLARWFVGWRDGTRMASEARTVDATESASE